jgi:phosphate starvation-inducible protein PhoH and related proteins
MAKNRGSDSISITAKNAEQKEMLRIISEHDVTFVKGSPGSGKTFVAVGYALQELLSKNYKQVVFTRPVVEAGGEKLGFLPGNMYEKIDPYMMPILESLTKILPAGMLNQLMPRPTNGNGNGNGNGHGSPISFYAPIRILPLAYMRGLTFSDTIIVADEVQNCTPLQIRMLLTRLGTGSKMILSGDVEQTDISAKNGLIDAFELLQDIPGMGFVTLSQESIMRHPIIKHIENRYSIRDSQKKAIKEAKEVKEAKKLV